jgi:pyruvate formate lyase activating enzyme
VHDLEGSSTYCLQCGATLIGRDWYSLSTWGIEVRDGQAVCGSCGNSVAGIFEDRPGAWGARRQPVRISAH